MQEHSVLMRCVILLAVICVPIVAWSDEPSKKLPIPDEAAQKEADELVKEVFGDERQWPRIWREFWQ